MSQIKYGILHWGPCIVKTKVDQATLDLLLSEGEASKEDASPELAGVLKNQFHYRDKINFINLWKELLICIMLPCKDGKKQLTRHLVHIF
tara:strand:+ start:501 stop:770 length:270 start_codon:yes stop_codon:yes gene_type:complete